MISQPQNQEKKYSLQQKKISKKYKKLREANARKRKYKLPREIVTTETVETPQGEVKVLVSIEKFNKSGKKGAKKIIKRIRQDQARKNIQKNCRSK